MKTEETTIGSFHYKMELLGAVTGRDVMLRLLRPVGAMFKPGRGRTMLDMLDIGAAVQALSSDDLAFVCDAFAARTRYSNGVDPRTLVPLEATFDEHFAGRYDDLIAWLVWAVDVNRFFAGALESFATLKGAARGSPSDSLPTSTGGSGDSSFRHG